MTKVLVATEKPFAAAAVNAIRNVVEAAGFELVLLEKYTEKKQLLEAVADVDAIIIRSDIIDAEVVERAANLKIVVRAGAGYDNIDLAACTAKGVVAMNTPGQNSNAVAELAIGMMLMIARNNYDGTSGTEIKDKTLGIHAYGWVGKNLARAAKGFNMKIMAFDPFIDKSVMENDGIIVASSVEELYKSCQYVSLHIPANDKTKKSINRELLSLMPKNGVLVNTARKEVIDEAGLLQLFEERPDLRYVSDIAPDNAADFKEKYGNRVFFTPKKLGAQTSEANNNAGIAAAEQIVNFIKNGDKTYQVNK
ncbi:MAG: 3-phosphoglycerate dehydrogenase [Bacteroidetes bacterium HGW-Bacteroidetes-6]|jgi:D-3-phosphoglycerate dehydrogenase|nr:MAG: 3-phosphoglycerate dehydrogenase [Bacteroidetes bacterium HGW-Bacteroidetes-6]